MQDSNHGDKFSLLAAKEFARFMTTYNMVSQAVVEHGSVTWDLKTTGTGDCTINGVYIPSLTVNTAHDISVDQAAPTTTTEDWSLVDQAAGTKSWAVDDECYTGVITTVNQKFYKCLIAHDLAPGTEPEHRKDLWQDIPNADGYSLANDFRCWTMITADSAGLLGVWIASTVATAIGVGATLVVPYFDPAVYCVIAFGEYANDAGSTAIVFGASGDWSTDGGLIQVIGPVLPHPDNMPNN
jgi:hypothetical protein